MHLFTPINKQLNLDAISFVNNHEHDHQPRTLGRVIDLFEDKEEGRNYLGNLLGPFPFLIIGHLREKETRRRGIKAEIDNVLKNGRIVPRALRDIFAFQDFSQIQSALKTPQDFQIHKKSALNIAQICTQQIFDYREFVSRLPDDFNPHTFSQIENKERFFFHRFYGFMQEPWTHTLLQFYFSEVAKNKKENDFILRSRWFEDMRLGIDLTIGGVPVDITIETEHQSDVFDEPNRKRVSKGKVKKVKGRNIALLKPPTYWSSDFSYLFREAMWAPMYSLPEHVLRYGLKQLPDSFFWQCYRDQYVKSAVNEIALETERYVLPYLSVGDPCRKATIDLLNILND